jgi:alkylation response protein AidB-like acyl-CoA dehydrogenase
MDTVAAARALGPSLRSRSEEIESARRIPADLAGEFAAAGFHGLLAPEAYGGLEVPPRQMFETVEALAEADGSAAWCVFIHATSATMLAYLPESEARAVFSTPTTTLAGVFAPRGIASVDGDGFRVSGRWAWGSGTENADWILGGCRIVRDGEVEAGPGGRPIPRLALVPAGEVRLLDTWRVSGLCGTGSTDFAIDDVFVPQARIASPGLDRPLDRPLYAFPNFALLAMGIAAVALGLARASIREAVALAGAKTPDGSARKLANRPHVQGEIARAEAGVRSARAFLMESIETAWEVARRDSRIGVEQRRDLRLATTWATGQAAAAVDRMYEVAGGTAVYRDSPLQRHFRDVHAATQHMMVGTSTYELTGRLLLGLETDTSFL